MSLLLRLTTVLLVFILGSLNSGVALASIPHSKSPQPEINAEDFFTFPEKYLKSRNHNMESFIHAPFEICIKRDGLLLNIKFEPGNQNNVIANVPLCNMTSLKGTVDNFLIKFIEENIDNFINNNSSTPKLPKRKKNKPKPSLPSNTKKNIISFDEINKSKNEHLVIPLEKYIKDPSLIAQHALESAIDDETQESSEEIILNKLKTNSLEFKMGFKFGRKPKNKKNNSFNTNIGFELSETPWGRVVFTLKSDTDEFERIQNSLIKLPLLYDMEEFSIEVTLELGAKLLNYFAHFNNISRNIKKSNVPISELIGLYLSAVTRPNFVPLFNDDYLSIIQNDDDLSIAILIQPGIQDGIKALTSNTNNENENENENKIITPQPYVQNINAMTILDIVYYIFRYVAGNYNTIINDEVIFFDREKNKFIDESINRAFNKNNLNIENISYSNSTNNSTDPEDDYATLGSSDAYCSDSEITFSDNSDKDDKYTEIENIKVIDNSIAIMPLATYSDDDYGADSPVLSSPIELMTIPEEDEYEESTYNSDIDSDIDYDSDGDYNSDSDSDSDDELSSDDESENTTLLEQTELETDSNHQSNNILDMVQKLKVAHSKNKKSIMNETMNIIMNHTIYPTVISFNYGYKPDFRNKNPYNPKTGFSYINKHEIPWGRVVFIISSTTKVNCHNTIIHKVSNNTTPKDYLLNNANNILKAFELAIDNNKKKIDGEAADYYV